MQNELAHELLKVKTANEFIGCFFNPPSAVVFKTKWTYELFARRAGFSSKSFIYSVIKGHKKLTLESTEKVIKALKLNKAWSDYFRALVDQTYNKKSEINDQKIKDLKNKILKSLNQKLVTVGEEDKEFLRLFPAIYASMGAVGKGATLDQICSRSKIPKPMVTKVLTRLTVEGLIQNIEDRFAVNTNNIHLEKNIFVNNIKTDLIDASKKMINRSDKKSSIFYLNTFSVKSKDLHLVKEKIQNILAELAVETENDEGDCVADLVFSLTAND